MIQMPHHDLGNADHFGGMMLMAPPASQSTYPYTVTTVRKVRATATRVYARDPEHAAQKLQETRRSQGGKYPVTEIRVYAGHVDPKLIHQHEPCLVMHPEET